MCREPESNWRHQVFQTCALPTELSRQAFVHNDFRSASGPLWIEWPTFGPHLPNEGWREGQRVGFTAHSRRPSALRLASARFRFAFATFSRSINSQEAEKDVIVTSNTERTWSTEHVRGLVFVSEPSCSLSFLPPRLPA